MNLLERAKEMLSLRKGLTRETVDIEDSKSIEQEFVITKTGISTGRVDGVAISAQGIQSAAETGRIGIQEQIHPVALPPQGEAGSAKVGSVLAEWFGQAIPGSIWRSEVFENRDDDVDLILTAKAPERTVRVQVTRPGTKRLQEWAHAHRNGTTITGDRPTASLASEILAAVGKKRSKLAPAQRSNLVLAIDVRALPGFALDSVVEEFRVLHGEEVSGAGFKRVLIVGPTVRTTHEVASDGENL